jgi:small GTP-binding protein
MQKVALKIMLLGEVGVGKTSIAQRFVLDKFETSYKATIGVDIFSYVLKPQATGHDGDIELLIWDVDGEYEQHIFSHIYLEGASAALIVSDIARPATHKTALGLWETFTRAFPGRPAFLLINKCDLQPGVTPLANPQTLGIETLWTSAKTGQNVAEAFQRVALACIERGLDQ